MSRGLVLFSGGGTVGHLAPGFALAEDLRARGYECRFATPGEAKEAAWFPPGETPLRLPATRLPRSLGALAAFGPRLLRQTRFARRQLGALRPRLLVALGGWPCVPALLAARRVRVPLALVVSDAVPGLVVRKLWRRAHLLLLLDPRARQALPASAPAYACRPPLRAAVREGAADPEAYGLAAGVPTLLVAGGSQGSRGMDAAWLGALEAVLEREPERAAAFQVLHASAEPAAVGARYAALGVRACVRPFFAEMGRAYRTASLALCRAGAGTCSELAALGLPAWLVPYPHHKDRQQYLNAEPLVAAGGARLLEQEALDAAAVRGLLALLADPPALDEMGSAMHAAAASGDQAAPLLIRLMEEGSVGSAGDPLSEGGP